MATTTSAENGLTNGVNGHHAPQNQQGYPRFSDIPAVIDIPVRGEDGDEAVNLDLTELLDETDELCDLLENENAARTYWVTIALAYAKQDKVDIAIDILNKGLAALSRARNEDRLSVLACLCWLYLKKCRHAPRVKPSQAAEDERTKDHFLHLGTQTLNEASRINPSYPPLFLARGTLYLLRASLQPARGTHSEHSERTETLKQAAKSFDDAYRVSGGKNVMAIVGKAKAQYSLGSVAQALGLYQQALERAPDMLEPDPRIGIGCCLWQLGHKEQARLAWQRALDLSPHSVSAHILLGLYYLDQANQYNPKDEAFAPLYKAAMTEHTQTAFKLDGMHALACATFGSYFLLRRTWANVERLARRAIEHTDINATASDGWYLLARKDHFEGDMPKASEHYTKADQARGGDDRGYLPAKFGNAQMCVFQRDFEGAKFRLEKIVEKSQSKSVEAMTLLGILYAEEVYVNQAAGNKEDKSQEAKKAIAMFEQVRLAWRDPKRNGLQPDQAVLLNLARLYETDAPEKALACLLQVEQLELDDINEDDLPDEVGDEAEERRVRRELIPPQLLNNIGCFHFAAEKFTLAREYFQTALSACVAMGERQEKDEGVEDFDTDALVSTISYNLARTYEAENIDDEASKIYQGLLDRHPDYIDANTRLAYLAFKSDSIGGGEVIKRLMESNLANLEVRALYGWYLNRMKKRTLALNEDVEQRHYKQTLQTYDKHDLYALTGMGNLHLVVAREMPRDTDLHKERRSKTYMRAVEFFDKVLTLDPKNAYSAQGMGIAVMEDKKDTGAALQIFTKVRESVKDGTSVYVNLGHALAEVKQFAKAIENYEIASQKLHKASEQDLTRESQILACLGRTWLMRGRQERSLDAYKNALDFSRQALTNAPDNISYRFNVAFVQIQLAQMIIAIPEAAKTLQDVEQAAQGLDEAIETFGEIAKLPNPPFPRNDIEQRANMGRNTMKRQLATAVERQAEYEQKNASKLEEARKKREEEIRRREEEKRAAEEKREEERRKLREERERLAEEDRQLIERRIEEERVREAAEWTTDEETGERKKREKKPKEKRQKRKKKTEDSDTEGAEVASDGEGTRSRPRSGVDSNAASDGEAPRRKKKRKLESRKTRVQNSKYKSADKVVESSDDEDMFGDGDAAQAETPGAAGASDALADEEEDEAAVVRQQRKKAARVLDDDEDEEDEGNASAGGVAEAGDSDHGGDPL